MTQNTSVLHPSLDAGALPAASHLLLLERTAFNPWVVRFARFGMAARGVLWAVIGFMAVAAALGFVKAPVGFQDTLVLLESNPFRIPIGLAATGGLLGYATWGYIRFFFDPLGRGRSRLGLVERFGYLWSAVNYTLLAGFGAMFALSGESAGSGPLPFGLDALVHNTLGSWAVCVAGLVVVGSGIGQLVDAWRAPFRHDMIASAPRWLIRLWNLVGRFGYLSRGVAFGLIGAAIFEAGLRGDVHWAFGVAQIFAALIGVPAGAYLVVGIGIGFVAVGAHSLLAVPWLRVEPIARGSAAQ